jgi:hypothetical protein
MYWKATVSLFKDNTPNPQVRPITGMSTNMQRNAALKLYDIWCYINISHHTYKQLHKLMEVLGPIILSPKT